MQCMLSALQGARDRTPEDNSKPKLRDYSEIRKPSQRSRREGIGKGWEERMYRSLFGGDGALEQLRTQFGVAVVESARWGSGRK